MNLANISRMRSSVYLARMTNGMVKAGFTDNPRTRIASLSCFARRKYGCAVAEVRVFDGIGLKRHIPGTRPHAYGCGRHIEARCLEILNTLGTACAPSREFFTGVDYEEALRLIEADLSSLPEVPEPKQRPARKPKTTTEAA